MTAEKIDQALADAAEAVRHYYATVQAPDPTAVDRPSHAERMEHDVRAEVQRALRAGHTAAAIASRASLRQLLVARLVDDPQQRAAALVAARHDAQRYEREVAEALRQEARRRWVNVGGTLGDPDGASVPRGTKRALADELGVTRVTLDDWLSAPD